MYVCMYVYMLSLIITVTLKHTKAKYVVILVSI